MSIAGWQRASLPMLILSVLGVAPRHGYGISQALVAAGLQQIKGAQLYPALARLEDQGAIEAQWEQSDSGPARKVYELTAAGLVQREELHSQWHAFVRAAEAVGREVEVQPSRRQAERGTRAANASDPLDLVKHPPPGGQKDNREQAETKQEPGTVDRGGKDRETDTR